jgi:hypothetical protein
MCLFLIILPRNDLAAHFWSFTLVDTIAGEEMCIFGHGYYDEMLHNTDVKDIIKKS